MLQEQGDVTQGVNQVQNNRERPCVFISVINTESAPSVYAGAVPAGEACGCARPFVVERAGRASLRGPVRTPRPVSTVVPRGGWRPGITGEADHPGDPGVTKPRWAPSFSPFLSGAPKGRRSRLGASMWSGVPVGRAPMLHAQPVRLHLQAQVFSLRHETSASRADAGGGDWKAGHPSRNHPLPPLSMPSTWTPAAWGPGTAGSPHPRSCLVSATCALCPVRRTP